MPFQKGKSGNPAGRKKGAATRIVAELQQVVSADAKEIVRSIVAQAKAGDMESRRAFLKLLPQGRWPTPFMLPPIAGPHDIPPAIGAVLDGGVRGRSQPRGRRSRGWNNQRAAPGLRDYDLGR